MTYGVGDDVLGDDVLGDELDTMELEGMDLMGDDALGTALVGAARRRGHRGHRGGHPARAAKPRWRNQMAPGVPVPGYGVYPIPLTPQVNNGVFTGGNTQIEYRAVAQIPFRGERLLARVGRVGTTAAGALVFAQNGVFIGIRPQIGVLGSINLEDYQAGAFGVRMVMQPATQGAEIRVFAFVNPAVTGTDTLALSLQILGRVAT
jgi:hypothetical protein